METLVLQLVDQLKHRS